MATNPPLVPEGTPPVFTSKSPALCLQVHACDGQARASTMHLPHGPVKLPVFMPVRGLDQRVLPVSRSG